MESEGWAEAMMPLVRPEDFEMTTPPGLAAEPDTYRGEEGIRRYWESFYEVMEEIHVEPAGEFEEIEDWVLAPFTLRATGRTTGIESGIEGVMAWRWRDGKAVRALPFRDSRGSAGGYSAGGLADAPAIPRARLAARIEQLPESRDAAASPLEARSIRRSSRAR